MATIKDVAAAAGVQPATVSYVLNGTGSVSAATKARVLAAVAALGYQPSHTARSLQRRQSRTLGLVVPAERDPAAWGLIVNGLVDAAAAQEYELLVAAATTARSEWHVLTDLARSRRVDGVVVLQPESQAAASSIALDLPYVCVGQTQPEQPSVSIDNEAGMIEAVAHLVVQGYQRIALITPPLEWPLADEQDQGFRNALDEAGIVFEPELIVEGGSSESSGYDAASELLQRSERPDAIIAGLASLTFGTLHALHDLGLIVGRDVAVLAGEDPRAAAHIAPPLTALRQPYYALGQQLAHLLIQRVQGQPTSNVVLYPQLIVRRSCGEERGVKTE